MRLYCWSDLTSGTDLQERVSYDANRNVLSYRRNGNTATGKPLDMDKLAYNYKTGTNQLDYVYDTVPSGNYDADIDAQSAGNYTYDLIGNLVKDNAEHITSINWTVYGKISHIVKEDGTDITNTYGPNGNRISKTVVKTSPATTATTWYVRDASGNVMSRYESGKTALNDGHLTQSELHLYGSSRLGLLHRSLDVAGTYNSAETNMPLLGSGLSVIFDRGDKLFELSNHLGNVLVTVDDKKLGVSSNNNTVDYFNPQVVSAQDYYPFGMLQPGREINVSGYRYGFNGKENDNEVKGDGEQQDYGMRVYDPRLGRFLSVDPITKDYPWYSPYHFAGNTVIQAIDLDGKEEYHYTLYLDKRGETHLRLTSVKYYNKIDFGVFSWETKILTEKYVVNYNNENYYIGFAGANGKGNEFSVGLFQVWKDSKSEAKTFPAFFYSESQSREGVVSEGIEAARQTFVQALFNGFVINPNGTTHMLGVKGTQTPSKTMWKEKGTKARIDVENPNPGQRPGQIHFQDNDNVKYQYDVNENKFWAYDKETKMYSKEAPNKVNDLLNKKEIQKAIDKSLILLGETKKFNN